MLLRDIFSCVKLDDAVAKARAAMCGASQRNYRGMRSRACAASHQRDHSFFLSCILILFSGCASLAMSGCVGGQIIGANTNASAGSLQASPNNVSFGSVPLGTTTSASITLVNQGSAEVKVSQVTLAGQSFAVSGAGDLPIMVAAGHTFNLSVSFSPTTPGTASGVLTIASDAAANGTLVVELSGTGTAADAINPPELSSFSCVSGAVTGSATDSCTIALSSPAASGGFTVSVASNNGAVTVPATVTVPAGATSTSFTATITAVTTAQTVTLTAGAGGVAETFALQLNAASQGSANPPVLSGLSCNRSSMTGAGTNNCTITLNEAAPSGGYGVNLASNNGAVTVPAAVIVPAGATSASFTSTIAAVSTAQMVTLTASQGGVTETFDLQLNASNQGGASAPVLSGLSCGSSSMTGAGTDNCTITLNEAAPSGGFAVSVASNDSAVGVPASVTVAAGATTGSFTATIAAVSTAQTASLTASAGGVAETFALQLGVAVPGLGINAASIAFGNVNLNTPATQSVTLSSTGTAGVTVSLAIVTGNGFTISGATFPLTLSSSQSATISVQFDPTVAGAASGALTIVSTSLTNPTTTIGLSGTGVATVPYQVNLSWDAPTSSQDPVAGYIVFRSPSGASLYVQLNPTVVTETAYVDSNVQDGQTYDYIVESVDASGVLSVPSNTAVVPIP